MQLYIKTPHYEKDGFFNDYIPHILVNLFGERESVNPKRYFKHRIDSDSKMEWGVSWFDFPSIHDEDDILEMLQRPLSSMLFDNSVCMRKMCIEDDENEIFKSKLENILHGKQFLIENTHGCDYDDGVQYYEQYYQKGHILIVDNEHNVEYSNVPLDPYVDRKINLQTGHQKIKIDGRTNNYLILNNTHRKEYFYGFFLHQLLNSRYHYKERCLECSAYNYSESEITTIHNHRVISYEPRYKKLTPEFFDAFQDYIVNHFFERYDLESITYCHLMFWQRPTRKEIEGFFGEITYKFVRSCVW